MTDASFSLPGGRVLTWYQAGQGRPLVLLHGWAMSAAAFSEVAAMLAGEYRLLVPDLPGHGRSTVAVQNDLVGISADLACWLSSVCRDPVTLVGWSLGGMLALELAARQALPVERLVLIGTTPRFTQAEDWPHGLPAGQVRALARNLERRFEATLAEFFSLAFAGEHLAMERLRAIRTFAVKRSALPDRAAALALLEVLAGQDQRALLATVSQPALVMHGELDQIAPVGAGRALAELLPQGRFLGFPGIGHGPFLSDPLTTVAKIREFC